MLFELKQAPMYSVGDVFHGHVQDMRVQEDGFSETSLFAVSVNVCTNFTTSLLCGLERAACVKKGSFLSVRPLSPCQKKQMQYDTTLSSARCKPKKSQIKER